MLIIFYKTFLLAEMRRMESQSYLLKQSNIFWVLLESFRAITPRCERIAETVFF